MTEYKKEKQKYKHHVAVIVLGDVGRSPRMQYHTLSLLQNECQVSLIGYDGEDLIPDLISWESNSNSNSNMNSLKVIRFSTNKKKYSNSSWNIWNKLHDTMEQIPIVGKIWYYIIRVLSLIYMLYDALWIQLDSIPNCILIQNPPSIPLLFMTYIYCHSHYIQISNNNKHQNIRPGLIIDWHNLGYTMFGYTSAYHPIRSIAKQYEKLLAPKADAHLCVTHAMKDYLIKEQFIPTNQKNINVLHDKPPQFFHKCNAEEIHNLMIRYQNDFKDCIETFANKQHKDDIVEQTLFTIKTKKTSNTLEYEYQMKHNRPVLLVSSTSWTPDEDFNILLQALLLLEQMIQSKINSSIENYTFPKMIVTVTGKGPQKEHYQKLIQSINPTLSYIYIQTLWLSSSDYPLFIGSADLGISLHTSTSGIDLPMKVLDMMGCEVPVCAIKFKCLPELIIDGKNGKIFETEQELAHILLQIFETNKNNEYETNILNHWRDGIGNMIRWKENWNKEAKHIVFDACNILVKTNQRSIFYWIFYGAIIIVLIAILTQYLH